MQIVTPSQSELEKRKIVPLMKIERESKVAHKYLDGLYGVEIGAATYQPFGLNSVNVCTADKADRDFYNSIQLMVAGSYYEIDEYAEAHELPFNNSSQDYVIASHVLEHCPNPIAVLLEWRRIVKFGGYIYLIVPKRDNSPYGDANRDISALSSFMKAYREAWDDDTAFAKMWDRPSPQFDRARGHYWVFDALSLCGLVSHCNLWHDLNWTLLEVHDTDDKDGLGHMAVFRND